jgi:hypothetical protein
VAQSFFTAMAFASVPGGSIRYLPLAGTSGQSATEVAARFPIPCDGTLHRLWAQVTTNNTVTTSTLTLRLNGVDTGLTLDIPAGSTANHSNVVDDVQVSAGDLVSVRLNVGVGTNIEDLHFALGFTPDANNQSIVVSMATLTLPNLNRYHVGVGSFSANATEAVAQTLMPTSGGLGQIHAQAGTNTANGAMDVVLRANESDTAARVEIPAGSTALNTDANLAALSPGQRIGYRLFLGGSTSGVINLGSSMSFTPSVGKESVLLAQASVALNSNRTVHLFPTGSNSYQSTLAWTQALVPASGVLKKLHVQGGTNSLNGPCQVLVQVNGVDSALTTTIAAGSTAVWSDSTHAAGVAPGDMINFKFVVGGNSGSITQMRLGMVFSPLVELAGELGASSNVSGSLSVSSLVGLEGSSHATSTTAGQVVRLGELTGTIAGQGNLQGGATQERALLGDTSGSSLILGALVKRAGLGSLSAATASITGRLVRVVELEGQVTSASEAQAPLSKTARVTGTMGSQSSVGAQIDKQTALQGQSAGLSLTQGALLKRTGLGSASAGVTSTQASLTRMQGLTGQVAAVSTAEVVLHRVRRLQGAMSPQSAVGAYLVQQRPLIGAISAQSTAEVNLSGTVPLRGEVSAQTALHATLQVQMALSGTSQASTGANVVLTRYFGLAGNTSGTSGVEAQVILGRSFTAGVNAQSVLGGHLRVQVALAGSLDALSSVAGDLRTQAEPIALAGSVTAQSSTASALGRWLALQGTSRGTSQTLAQLGLRLGWSGLILAQSDTEASLSVAHALVGQSQGFTQVDAWLQITQGLYARVDGVTTVSGLLTLAGTAPIAVIDLEGCVTMDVDLEGLVAMDVDLVGDVA